jgi:hypothetical protein
MCAAKTLPSSFSENNSAYAAVANLAYYDAPALSIFA